MKFIKPASTVLLILILLAFIWLYISPNNSIIQDIAPDTGPLKDAQVSAEIIFQFDRAVFEIEDYSEREKEEQVRDWLMLALVSEYQTDVDQLSQSIFDKSPIRKGFVESYASLDYGPTRSFIINETNVVALLPIFNSKGDSISQLERFDLLAHIVDQQRKNLGAIPEQILPFSYEMEIDEEYAVLRKDKEELGETFFSKDNLYTEMKVTSKPDLEEFMAQIEDLTYVKEQNNELILGGRKLKSRKYKGIGVEEIATLWQAQMVNDDMERELMKHTNYWRKVTYTSDAEAEELKKRMNSEYNAIITSYGGYGNYTGDIGFSLDPTYDYDGLIKLVMDWRELLVPEIGEKKWAQIVDNLRSGNEKGEGMRVLPVLQLVDNLLNRESFSYLLALRFEREVEKNRFQKARYDGYLQGTEVGMVLFYTDLIAKLWTIDFVSSAPSSSKSIHEFMDVTKVAISKIYFQESTELPNARLWFGFEDNGFQLGEEDHEIYFARNASRIYAASSDPMEPGVEKPTTAIFAASLDWWNTHLEEIAAFEQEYERLNEIMKWSIVISWLDKNYNQDMINYLNDVKVSRNRWFSDWVKTKKDLKFNKWREVNFMKRGFNGEQTEVLPILYSPEYTFSGGVSLVGKSAIEAKPILQSTNLKFGRSDILNVSNNGKSIQKINGADFSLSTEGGVDLIIIKPPINSYLRNTSSQLKNTEISTGLLRQKKGMSLKMSHDKNPLGELIIQNYSNSYQVNWIKNDVELGLDLAKSMSKDPNFYNLLSGDNILSGIEMNRGNYLVKIRGSKKWVKLSEELEPSATLSNNWGARVSDIKGGLTNYNVKWIDGNKLFDELSASNEYIGIPIGRGEYVDKLAKTVKAEELNALKRKNIEVQINGGNIKGQYIEDSQTIYFKTNEIPENIKTNFSDFQESLLAKSGDEISALVKSGKPVPLVLRDFNSEINDLIEEFLNTNEPEHILQVMAKQPGYLSQSRNLEKQTANNLDQLISDGRIAEATSELQKARITFGETDKINRIKNALDDLKKTQNFNKNSSESILLEITEISDQEFIVKDFNGLNSQYRITEKASMLDEINFLYPDRKSIYVKLKSQNAGKEEAFYQDLRLSKKGKDIQIRKSPKNQKLENEFFESNYKVRSYQLEGKISPIVKRADGMFEATIAQEIRIKGVFKSLTFKAIGKTRQLLEDFLNAFKNVMFRTQSSAKLSDLVNSARRQLRKQNINMKEDDLLFEFMDEFGSIHLVQIRRDSQNTHNIT